MNRKQMSRCWSVPMLFVLLAVFLAPLFAHGNTVVGNETEADIAVNVTSSPTEGAEEKIEEVSRSTIATVLTLLTERKHREEEASGMLEEDFSPTPNSTEVATTTLAPPEISPDSAETDHLLPHSFMEEEEPEEEDDYERPHASTQPPLQGMGDEETTVFDLDNNTLPPTVPSTTSPPSPSDVTVHFFDTDSRRKNLDPPSLSPHELQGRDPTSWAMPGNYNYMTPYDSVSPTTDDYTSTTETYDDDISTTPPPKPLPPQFSNPDNTLIKVATVEESPRIPPSESSDGCQQGFSLINGTCRSPCELKPNHCFNGGQCHSLDGTQVFCRCNIQDYMWHRGSRCESVITEFQVMCIAIGSSTVMVLLLFMTIVCFAKKLHVLKTENNKLRKRSSKYRPSSEHHNDNFSLSTIAEGSHPNKTMSRYTWECKTKEEPNCEDDPNAQNKLEDPVKAPPPKEDESLNIQNSLTPKHENHKVLGEENSSEVNSLQNNMM
ncbi:chondroitin sulfate proteoglycan 5 isoform X3 [Triplophysa rosa]|uniref:Chondroitin sulfate proteoglycan 5 n=1 Tax=Triplophysa rosa TaxID=992332 RepID=A0A9W7WRR5_TRIRA|nr:chondroitin sulfate proteoglycan 5 isoform X3 [Triplophysa rosa]KAI7807129.1 putative chondroitin sulfate proteoglycan 5 [Triplophysa rosa]